MRVDALNHVSQLYETTKAKRVDKTQATNRKDAYEISQSAQDYQIAKSSIASIPDVREDKVSELKEAMASGTYNVSSQEIADKVVSKYFDSTI